MSSLFPGLLDDLGRACLLRVELNSHHNLRCVSKGWNAVLKSPSFYQERGKLEISEQRICFLETGRGIHDRLRVVIYDMEKDSYKSLPPIPIQTDGNFRCHFVKQKLVLITNWVTDGMPNSVWFYNFVCLKWREGTQMRRWVNGFASAADEERGLIYVGGGYDRFHSREDFSLLADPVRSASVYNVEEDKWENLPDMNTSMEPRQVGGIVPFRGVFVDGSFYVKSYPGVFEVFDSYTKTWKHVENELNQSAGIFVSAFGQIYFLTNMGMIEYDFRQEKSQVVGSLPAEDDAWDLKFAIVVNNKIFVCKWAKSEGMTGFYMLIPPSKTGEEFSLTEVQRPPGIQVVRDAATLDL